MDELGSQDIRDFAFNLSRIYYEKIWLYLDLDKI